jgi:hypothetical protein
MHLSRRKSLLSCARKNSSNADDWANHDGDAIFAAVPSTIAQARRDGGPGRFFPGRVRATNSRGIGRRSRCVSSSRLPRSPRGARGGSKSRTQHECHALSHNAHADAGGNRTIVHVTSPRDAAPSGVATIPSESPASRGASLYLSMTPSETTPVQRPSNFPAR